ncbi:hypothetical protein GCM10008957_22930 [Deinococcus ruber]|uniref:Uncharacterized protein n=1 Tax=Deinococcus ruber TaxID=1848197 RepID=A0A918F7W0_9DEIO|nr:hypothetical protein GCM10008957_22930 [Deinococcus ruber]
MAARFKEHTVKMTKEPKEQPTPPRPAPASEATVPAKRPLMATMTTTIAKHHALLKRVSES